MKTWKKIGLGLLIVLIGGVVYLYIAGSGASTPGDGPQEDNNPIFPFSSGSDSGEEDEGFFSSEGSENDEDDPSSVSQQPNLWQITDEPVAGSQWVTQPDDSEEIWYVRKDNGHVYSSSPDDRELNRLTNTTIPQVQEALIDPSGDYVVYRYLDDNQETIKTYLANLQRSSDEEVSYQLEGEFLSDNIPTVVLSPEGEQLFYLDDVNDGVVGVIRSTVDNNAEIIFESDITKWRGSWNSGSEITLFTKPDVNTEGFAYTLDTDTGDRQKLAEGQGLIASISPSGNHVLTSSEESGEYRGQVKERNNMQTTIMSPRTIADKCQWARESGVFFCGIPSNLPSDPLKSWYQGKESYTDTLTLFNPERRDQSSLFTEEEREQGPFDIVNISLDESSHYLIFENKRDQTLWGLEL